MCTTHGTICTTRCCEYTMRSNTWFVHRTMHAALGTICTTHCTSRVTMRNTHDHHVATPIKPNRAVPNPRSAARKADPTQQQP